MVFSGMFPITGSVAVYSDIPSDVGLEVGPRVGSWELRYYGNSLQDYFGRFVIYHTLR